MALENLSSGVTFFQDDAIQKGVGNLLRSLQSIEQIKIQDTEQKRAQFEKIIDISMKPIQGRFQDEAMAKRQEFLSNARKIAQETQGNLSWQQVKALREEKRGLEAAAGQYKELQDWYKTSVAQALRIKDKDAQSQSLQNIAKIMEQGGTLAETHAKTLDPTNWLVQAEDKPVGYSYVIDQMNEVFPSRSLDELLKADPITQKDFKDWISAVPGRTEEDWKKVKMQQFKFLKTEKDKTTKAKVLPVVKMGRAGNFPILGINNGKGIKFPSITISDDDGTRHLKNVTVIDIVPTKGIDGVETGYKVILSHPKLIGKTEEEIKANFFSDKRRSLASQERNWKNWQIDNPNYSPRLHPTETEESEIPLSDIYEVLKQNVKLEGIDESLIFKNQEKPAANLTEGSPI